MLSFYAFPDGWQAGNCISPPFKGALMSSRGGRLSVRPRTSEGLLASSPQWLGTGKRSGYGPNVAL